MQYTDTVSTILTIHRKRLLRKIVFFPLGADWNTEVLPAEKVLGCRGLTISSISAQGRTIRSKGRYQYVPFDAMDKRTIKKQLRETL